MFNELDFVHQEYNGLCIVYFQNRGRHRCAIAVTFITLITAGLNYCFFRKAVSLYPKLVAKYLMES